MTLATENNDNKTRKYILSKYPVNLNALLGLLWGKRAYIAPLRAADHKADKCSLRPVLTIPRAKNLKSKQMPHRAFASPKNLPG